MGFKEMVAFDLCQTFFNFEEFAELHTIDGEEILAVIDNDELKERQGTQDLAVEDATTLLYCRSCDLPKKRKPGQTLTKDGRLCTVADWKEDMGMTTIVLQENIVT